MRPQRFKRSKYNATPTYAVEELDGTIFLVDEKLATGQDKRRGIRFHSWAEADRYTMLRDCQKSGIITDLELQPPFECMVNSVLVTTYIADFRYKRDGKVVVEDVKGMETDVYELKKKLVEAIFNVYVKEIKPRAKPRVKKAKPKVSD